MTSARRSLLTLHCALLAILMTVFTAHAGKMSTMWGGKEVYMVRKADNFIILYDRSASMADMYAQTVMTELAAERKILLEKNATLPDMNWQAGIYSFTPGTGVENITTYYPMQAYDKKSFSRTIMKMPREPKGATLLQQGLWALPNILNKLTGKTVIFLFTDGQYTPVDKIPSPSVIASRLNAQFDLCFVVINTGAQKKELKEITAISKVNSCSYMVPFEKLLGNPEWMTYALFEIQEAKPAGSSEVVIGYEWENILFDFDKYNVKPEYFDILDKVAAFLKEHPAARIILAGHTDSIGTREYNMNLSHQRAASVRAYLVQKGEVSADRITLSGFGFDDPVATNDTSEGRALNRRVQGIISGVE